LYVERLVAPEVINTMPEQTLRAFAQHGTIGPVLDADPTAGEQVLAAAAAAGVDLPAITAELEREGVQSFADSYAELVRCIEYKRAQITPAAPG
jgi:transaldolase